MDLFLLVSSAALATRLPLPFHLEGDVETKSNKKSFGCKNTNATATLKQNAIEETLFRWTLFLSLCLFSLCTLETLSSNSPLLTFLAKDNRRDLFHPSSSYYPSFGSTTILFSVAYKILIAGQCILISFISPMAACSICLFPERIKEDDKDTDKKQRNKRQPSKMSYLILFPLQIFHFCYNRMKRLFFKKTIKTIPHIISETSVHDKRLNNRQTYKSNNLYTTKAILSWSLATMIVYFYWVYYLQTTTYHFRLWITRLWVTSLCSIGIFISSIFDGFGSVSMIYGCVAGFFLEPVDDVTIQTAEKELKFMTMNLEEKKKDLQMCLSINSNDSDDNSISHSRCVEWWKSRSRSSLSEKQHTSDNDKKKDYSSSYDSKRLQQEVRTLENLSRDLMNELEDTKYIQNLSRSSQSRWSLIRFWVGTIFSVILSIRLLFACRAIFLVLPSSKGHKNDPITTILLWLVGHHIVNQTKYNSTSQFVSLVLTAFLSISQIRNLLRVLQTIRREIGRKVYWMQKPDMTLSTSVPLKRSRVKMVWGCLQSSLMGCYFLSCVISIKDNVPIQYQTSFRIALFGDSKITSSVLLDSNLRNETFVSSAFVATLIVLLSHSIRRKLSVLAKTSEWNHGAFTV